MGKHRILEATRGARVGVHGLMLTSGMHTYGGAMLNAGELHVTDFHCMDSRAEDGGCLYNTGQLTVNKAVIKGNIASGCGGGLYLVKGSGE
jgi:hypothetical protein